MTLIDTPSTTTRQRPAAQPAPAEPHGRPELIATQPLIDDALTTAKCHDHLCRLDPLDRLRVAADLLDGLTFPALAAVDIGEGTRRFARAEGSLRAARGVFLTAVDAMNRRGECASAAEELVRHANVSPRTAGQMAKEAQTLAEMPHVAEQVSQGNLSTDHTAVLGGMLDKLDESDRAAWIHDQADLAHDGTVLTPGQFRKELERRHERELAADGVSRAEQGRMNNTASVDVNLATGRTQLRLDADPTTGLLIRQEIDAEVDRMIRNQDWGDSHPDKRSDRSHLRFHALVRLITRGALHVDGHTPTLAELTRLVVHVDVDTLTEQLTDNGQVCELEDGSPLSPSEIRQMACCAEIIPVVLNGDSVVLDEGRGKRLATPQQRVALSAMYATCGRPGCDVPFHRCHIHHIEWWEHGGTTDLRLLIPLCPHDHHLIHDQGWHIVVDPDTRTVTWQRPDHTEHDRQPLEPRRSARPPDPGG